MGQRTQIFLIVEEKNGNGRVDVYHDQWGVGRRMPLALMHVVAKFYYRQHDDDIRKVFSITDKELAVHHDYIIDYDKHGKLVGAVNRELGSLPGSFDDWKKPSTFLNFVHDHCDNNYGVMAVSVKEKDNGNEKLPTFDLKIGFLDGPYSEAGFSTEGGWLTPEEYLSLPGSRNHADKNFRNMFRSFLDCFGFGMFAEKEAEDGHETE